MGDSVTKFSATEEFTAPLPSAELHTFLLGLPDEAVNAKATLDIDLMTEGQRDVYTVGYRITARWEQ
jgi:hypothetical protein